MSVGLFNGSVNSKCAKCPPSPPGISGFVIFLEKVGPHPRTTTKLHFQVNKLIKTCGAPITNRSYH